MTQSEIAWNAGTSMVTFFNSSDYSFLLGSDIFVAPFLQSGTSISVKFPGGSRWIYMNDESKFYDGCSTENLSISYDEYPVFLRKAHL